MFDFNHNKSSNSLKKSVCLIFLLILIIALSIFVYNYYLENKDKSETKSGYTNIEKISKISDEEKQKAVDESVEEGMINICYAISATFEGKNSTSFKVINKENNKYPIAFQLYDENDNLMFTSSSIDLGYECKEITLNKEHKKGTFEWKIKIGYDVEGSSNVQSFFPINVTIK